MTYRSRSTLFLIEQLIVIAVFAICAAACIRILTTAYFYATDSKAASNALLTAESCAEVFKATGGDIIEVVRTMGGTYNSTSVIQYIYYDKSWQVCNEADAYFMLRVYSAGPPDHYEGDQLYHGGLAVDKITGENLVVFPLAARR